MYFIRFISWLSFQVRPLLEAIAASLKLLDHRQGQKHKLKPLISLSRKALQYLTSENTAVVFYLYRHFHQPRMSPLSPSHHVPQADSSSDLVFTIAQRLANDNLVGPVGHSNVARVTCGLERRRRVHAAEVIEEDREDCTLALARIVVALPHRDEDLCGSLLAGTRRFMQWCRWVGVYEGTWSRRRKQLPVHPMEESAQVVERV